MYERLTEGIGERLARYRKLAGISAQELSDRTGGSISRGVIANIETGRKIDLTVEEIATFAWALEVPFFSLALPLDHPSQWVAVIASDTMDESVSVMDAWQWMIYRPEPFNESGRSEENAARLLANVTMRKLLELGQTNLDIFIAERAVERSGGDAESRRVLEEKERARDSLVEDLIELGVSFDRDDKPGEPSTDAASSSIRGGPTRIIRKRTGVDLRRGGHG